MIRNTSIPWQASSTTWPGRGSLWQESGFALVVIFMQLGFSQAVERTATLVLGKLDFDILIVSKSYVFLAAPGSFPWPASARPNRCRASLASCRLTSTWGGGKT